MSPISLPEIFSSLPKHSRNISLTSSNSELFLLQNNYTITTQKIESTDYFVFKNQVVNKINPSKNILKTINIESDESFNQIRYGNINNFEILLASAENNPSALKYCAANTKNITFADFFSSKKEILAWDIKENQLIILFSDLTVELFKVNLSNDIPSIENRTILDSLDDPIKRPVIQINPFKGSFLLWEAIANGKTWMLFNSSGVESFWCNVRANTHVSILNEAGKFSETNDENLDVFIGENSILEDQSKRSSCSFFILGNTQENSSHQWLSIGTRTIDEGLFDKQFPRGR
jgi:hypothetical protein